MIKVPTTVSNLEIGSTSNSGSHNLIIAQHIANHCTLHQCRTSNPVKDIEIIKLT